MTNSLKALAKRFQEPSSWAGLAGLVALMGLHLDPGAVQSLTLLGSGIAGLLAILLPE